MTLSYYELCAKFLFIHLQERQTKLDKKKLTCMFHVEKYRPRHPLQFRSGLPDTGYQGCQPNHPNFTD